MFVGLPKENAAIIDFYLKDCCFDTHNYQRKRASRRLGTSPEKVDDVINDRNVMEKINGSETDSVVSSSGSCSTNGCKPYDMYCRTGHDSDAESTCQSGYHEDNDQSFTEETLADEIHRQELNAYRSTLEALHASGPLTWEKETMVTDLRLSLHISNDEHLIMLKNLLSASSSCHDRTSLVLLYVVIDLDFMNNYVLADVGSMWEGQNTSATCAMIRSKISQLLMMLRYGKGNCAEQVLDISTSVSIVLSVCQ
ncbi:EMSY domain-containing protein [Tanacetum coccineum]